MTPAFAIASLITLFDASGRLFSSIYINICFSPLTSNSRVQRSMFSVMSDVFIRQDPRFESVTACTNSVVRFLVFAKSSYAISLGVQSTADRINIRCRKATSKKQARPSKAWWCMCLFADFHLLSNLWGRACNSGSGG